MGVLQPRGRRDSRASALSRNLMFDRDIHVNAPSETLVEHANLGSPPGPTGAESSSYNGSTMRTPNRSFYHRSFNTNMDPAHYSSDGLRTGLACPPSLDIFHGSQNSASYSQDEATSSHAVGEALSEPGYASVDLASASGSSALTEMIRRPSTDTVEDQVTQPGMDDISFPPAAHNL
ncbi:hypothetical protein N7530_003601 [Penicillium desertorum]|uniref:Uncharacterized protein n=1 Tax=Penicillium desertorum TaxID=1303715 RepID=A0A9W9WWR6_9EURO|nr:hypothetical protein N7530_003601 [Penicillium desertorum]